MSIVEKLTNIGVIQKGDFVLKSGKTSNLYFDLKKLISYPLLMKEICSELTKYIDKDCVLCGVPIAGIRWLFIIQNLIFLYNIKLYNKLFKCIINHNIYIDIFTIHFNMSLFLSHYIFIQ